MSFPFHLEIIMAEPRLYLNPTKSKWRWRAQWRDDTGKVRSHSFGVYPTKARASADRHAIRAEFDLWLGRWRAIDSVRHPEGKASKYTVVRLAADYLRDARKRYVKRGKRTSTAHDARRAMRTLAETAGRKTPADQLRMETLARVRRALIVGDKVEKRAVKTVNLLLNQVKQAIVLACDSGHIGDEFADRASNVRGVRDYECGRGRTKREPDLRTLARAIRDMPETVADLVRLQWRTGMRPGEALMMQACHLDMSRGDVWVYTPPTHKNEHHDKERHIAIGPRAVQMLQGRIGLRVQKPLFAVPGTDREYRRDSYLTAVKRACEAAGVEPFNPYGVRHAYSTRARRVLGPDVSNMLGNSLAVGANYGTMIEAAVAAARKVG